MVQKKLGHCHADHVKTENLLFQHQDMKKKMKKSGSINKRPKKSPAAVAPPRTTPNYMKSTTSSDARKSPDSCSRKSSDNSKLNSASAGKKATKTLATKNPSFKPARASVRKCAPLVLCEAERATCSSTLKDCKFPEYLSLNHGGTESEGTSKIKVCPYTYCSLNGHRHAPLPPLKCFISARRSIIKTHRSISLGLGCVSPRPISSMENKDFFIEIHSKDDEHLLSSGDEERVVVEMLSDGPICNDFDCYDENRDVLEDGEVLSPAESTPSVCFNDSQGSDMEWETRLDYDYDCDHSNGTFVEPDPEADMVENYLISSDEFIIKSDSKVNEFFMDEVSQESFDELSLNSDGFSSSDDSESTGSNDNRGEDEEETTSFDNRDQDSPPNEDATAVVITDQVSNHEENFDHNIITLIDQGKEHHSDGGQLGSAESIFNKDEAENAVNPEIEDSSSLARVTANSKKKPIEESEELGSFNPREPNFLPLEPDPEAEKVDLKHQDLDERKNAEEWMVDYALRQVVTKLGPARKRKVALLVEAFEKVIPVTRWDLHLKHSPTFDQARPIQACS